MNMLLYPIYSLSSWQTCEYVKTRLVVKMTHSVVWYEQMTVQVGVQVGSDIASDDMVNYMVT